MDALAKLAAYMLVAPVKVQQVVEFDAENDKVLRLNLTATNESLTPEMLADSNAFGQWINEQLSLHECRYGVGGYLENRTIYNGKALFANTEEPRSLHLGIDVWAPAGTAVRAPLDAIVHSFADNNNVGDYGPTIILQHDVNGLPLFSLYGHLNRSSLQNLKKGDAIKAGQKIASLGQPEENGNWPPHLHFQLMLDMEGHTGDYPGVCRLSEKAQYLNYIPDPAILLPFPETAFI
jgi:peptidoglycan LD-endopeptidase LytH